MRSQAALIARTVPFASGAHAVADPETGSSAPMNARTEPDNSVKLPPTSTP